MEYSILLPQTISINSAIFLIFFNFLTCFISTALSLGGGMLMLVGLSFILPTTALIPVHGLVQLGSNFGRIFVSIKDLDKKIILPFVIGTIVGSLFGANIVDYLSPGVGQVGVGLFILYSLFGTFPPLGRKYILVGGIATTIMSMLFGASGPIVSTLIRNMGFNPTKHVTIHGAFMTSQHLFKSIGFFFIGFAFQEYILLVATMIFVGFFGTYFGKKVLISKGKHYFQKVLTIILLLGGIRIIYLGLQNLNLL